MQDKERLGLTNQLKRSQQANPTSSETLTSSQIREDQRSLASGLRAYQEQQARSSYQQGQRQISSDISRQQREMRSNRQQLAEQSQMTQRAVQQGAQARGLGSSGLRDASMLQAQMQHGRALNEMEQVNAEVNKEVLNTRLALEESLLSNLMAAGLQEQEAFIGADESAWTRQQQQNADILELVSMSAEGMDLEQIMGVASVMGIDWNATTESGITVGDAIAGAGQNMEDLMTFDDIDLLTRGEALAAGGTAGGIAGTAAIPIPVIGTIFGALAGAGGAYLAHNQIKSLKYNIGGEEVQFESKDEVLNHFRGMFGSRPEISSGAVQIMMTSGGDIRFQVGGSGKKYKTFADARKALRGTD